MSESRKKAVVGILAAVFFCAMIVLVVMGQRRVGPGGLGLELLGLTGLILLLWLYNRQYK